MFVCARCCGDISLSFVFNSLLPLPVASIAQRQAMVQMLIAICSQVRDPEEGFKWIRKAAGQGLAIAQFIAGAMYATGEGIPVEKGSDPGMYVDLQRAARWFRAAARRGHPEAHWELAQLLRRTGSGVKKRKIRRKIVAETDSLVLRAAELGVAGAQLEAGRMYKEGRGFDVNATKSVKWLRLAAKQVSCRHDEATDVTAVQTRSL